METATKSVRIIRMRDLKQKMKLGQSTLHALIAKGAIPKPFHLVPGGRAVGWYESDIDDWLETRRQLAGKGGDK